MSRPKKTTSRGAPPAAPRPKADRVFSQRGSKDPSTLTHERIAADLDSFHKAGGKIEVLGVTRTLRKIDPDDTAAPSAPAVATPSPSRR